MNEPTPEMRRRPRRRLLRPRHLLTATVASLVTASTFAVAAVDAADSSSPDTTFVAITPCRLADTRPAPDRVGEVVGALGPASTTVLAVTGTHGNCAIPASARAVALNATALDATEPTFVTFSPAGGARPLSSNLNPFPGQPPTPNTVDVALGADGALEVFNAAGSVELVLDVTGYYTTSAIDELRAALDGTAAADDVYTRAEVDVIVENLRADLEAQLATKAATADVYTKTEIDAFNDLLYTKDEVDAAIDRSQVVAARSTGAGVKQTPGPYTVTRLIEGEYEFVFDVSDLGLPGNSNTPVISAMARCPATVGYTSGGVVIAPGTGLLQSVVARLLVFDAGGPLDCGLDVQLKLGNP